MVGAKKEIVSDPFGVADKINQSASYKMKNPNLFT